MKKERVEIYKGDGAILVVNTCKFNLMCADSLQRRKRVPPSLCIRSHKRGWLSLTLLSSPEMEAGRKSERCRWWFGHFPPGFSHTVSLGVVNHDDRLHRERHVKTGKYVNLQKRTKNNKEYKLNARV